MSADLFRLLTDYAATAGEPVEQPTAPRFIKKLNDDDSALMSDARVDAPVIVTRQIRLVRLTHLEKTFFCTFGLSEPEMAPPGLEIIDPTPGLFSNAVLTARIRPIPPQSTIGNHAFAIKEALDTQYMGSPGYEGHDLEDVAKLFPRVTVYRAIEDRAYLEIDDRVLGAILVRSYADGPISLDDETLFSLLRIFEEDSDLIPFRNIVQGFLSISWEALFIEIYRCIEQLYALPRAEALKAELTSTISARDLAKILENHLSWRPKEVDAFEALVRMCDESIVSRLFAGLDCVAKETHNERCSDAVNELYGLRNKIVHYRPIHERVQKDDDSWNVIVRGMLDIVSKLYNTKAHSFFSHVS